jgi:hypothetical protein
MWIAEIRPNMLKFVILTALRGKNTRTLIA